MTLAQLEEPKASTWRSSQAAGTDGCGAQQRPHPHFFAIVLNELSCVQITNLRTK